MSNSQQCSNRLELDLISILVNFSCELGPIMTRYDFLWARWFWVFEPTWTWPNLTFGQLFMWLGQTMISYDFLWDERFWAILSDSERFWAILSDSERFWAMFKPTWIWPNFTFGPLFSSAVPTGSGAIQMPTRPSSSAAASASTLRGGRANLRNASVTFSLFLHEASLGWH